MSPAELRQVLADLEAAEFPRDFPEFYKHKSPLSETEMGQRVTAEWAKLGGTQIFLRQLQAELHRASARRLAEYRARLRSPKRDLLRNEPVPITAAKLRAEIKADEAQAQKAVLEELGARLNSDLPTVIAQFVETFGELGNVPDKPAVQTAEERKRRAKRRQRRAWRQQDSKPDQPEIRSWSTPMSVADYVAATGMQRGAVEDFLRDKLKARPLPRGRRPVTEARRYPVAVNLKMLAHWIEHWQRNSQRARDLALATLTFAEVYDKAFLPKLIRTLAPVLSRRRLAGPELLAALKAHRDYYAPKPDPFASLLKLAPPA